MQAEVLALGVLILLFSVILHEVMHGWAALQFGDHTAERAGRLTLNPIPHIDPIGTILVPAVLILPAVFLGVSPGFIIGWAKPVPVNPLNFRDLRRGELLVSAAGVLINLALAVVAALGFHLARGAENLPLQSVLLFAVNINLILAIFNSLPIPPLDGSKMLISFLPAKMAASFARLEKYGFLILLFLLFFPFGPISPLGVVLGFFLDLFRSILGI